MTAGGRDAGPAHAEVRQLLRPHPRLGVPLPAYGGRSLVNLPATIARAVGVELDGDPAVAPPLTRTLDPFVGRRAEGTVVQFLIDGFGWNALASWTDGERRGRWLGLARPMTTVFPTTTTAALESLSSATPPGRHGLVGYRQYLPRFGVVADMLKMSPLGVVTLDALIGPEWGPQDIVGVPTVFRRGLAAAVVTRDRFAGSGFSRVIYDGAEFVGYATATDLAHELARVLARDSPPKVVYVYWDELDTIQHLKGVGRDLFGLELSRIAHLIEYVGMHLPDRQRRTTLLTVSGDHGQVPTAPEAQLAVDREPAIVREMSRPLGGDRRAGLFAARPGRLGSLRDHLRERLPAGSRIVDVPDAIEAGVFGPPPFHPELADRLGDLLVLVPSPAALTYTMPGQSRSKRFLVGGHGGLEPDELVVPLVAGTLEEYVHPRRPTSKR